MGFIVSGLFLGHSDFGKQVNHKINRTAMLLTLIDIKEGVQLADYENYVTLTMEVSKLRKEAATIIPKLKNQKIWMISSTAKGGGVAEMMPRKISLLRQLGVAIEWGVISPDQKDFFQLTKKIHNMMHGEGNEEFNQEEQILYESINRQSAQELLPYLSEGDIVVIHDPQPLGMVKYLKQAINIHAIWRCHIGYEKNLPPTRKAWQFLQPYLEAYDHAVFTAEAYIPKNLVKRTSIIYPAIDPLSHKNRELFVNKLIGILCNANLVKEYHPLLTPDFTHPVQRILPDGSMGSPISPNDAGLLFSPLVTQISRWDKLKGFRELMEGFVQLKKQQLNFSSGDERHQRRLKLMKLVLAGPEPDSIQDDPEGQDVIQELIHDYQSLSSQLQNDIVMLMLPMKSLKHNALIVNALQRISSVVVQNSIREGFGLTATEAMWKNSPVMIGNAYGLRQQVRDDIDGKIVRDSTNVGEVANTLNEMLKAPKQREVWGFSAQKRVLENFLIFKHLQNWLSVFDFVNQEH